MSRSNRLGGAGGDTVIETATARQPVRERATETEFQAENSQPRGRLRRPRDPRKLKRTRVRPPRRNPYADGGRPEVIKTERVMMYDHDDDSYDYEEDQSEE